MWAHSHFREDSGKRAKFMELKTFLPNFRRKFARKVFSSMNFALVPESSRKCESAHIVNAYREHFSRASNPIEGDFHVWIRCYFWQRQRLRQKACECYGPIDGLGVHWDDLYPS